MPITDIKGMKYVFNETITPLTNVTFNVDFTTKESLRQYKYIKCIDSNNMYYDDDTLNNTALVYENGVWVADDFRYVTFLDGDTTNVDLIAYLNDNGRFYGFDVNFTNGLIDVINPATYGNQLLYKTDKMEDYAPCYDNGWVMVEDVLTIQFKNTSAYILEVSTTYEGTNGIVIQPNNESDVISVNENTKFYLFLQTAYTLTLTTEDDSVTNNDFYYTINTSVETNKIKMSNFPIVINDVYFIKIINNTNDKYLHFEFNNSEETIENNSSKVYILNENTTLDFYTSNAPEPTPTPTPTGYKIVGEYLFNTYISAPTQQLNDLNFTLKYPIEDVPVSSSPFYKMNFNTLNLPNYTLEYVSAYGKITAWKGRQTGDVYNNMITENWQYKYIIFSESNVDEYTYKYLISNGRFGTFDPPYISDNDLILYQNTAEINRVDKTDYLKVVGSTGGVFRQPTSVVNLELDIQYDKFPDFNYVYYKPLERYYYVVDVELISNKLFHLNLSVDVLMSFKDAILNSYGFIDRNEFEFNPNINDDKIVIKLGQNIDTFTIETEDLDTTSSCVINGLLLS